MLFNAQYFLAGRRVQAFISSHNLIRSSCVVPHTPHTPHTHPTHHTLHVRSKQRQKLHINIHRDLIIASSHINNTTHVEHIKWENLHTEYINIHACNHNLYGRGEGEKGRRGGKRVGIVIMSGRGVGDLSVCT